MFNWFKLVNDGSIMGAVAVSWGNVASDCIKAGKGIYSLNEKRAKRDKFLETKNKLLNKKANG